MGTFEELGGVCRSKWESSARFLAESATSMLKYNKWLNNIPTNPHVSNKPRAKETRAPQKVKKLYKVSPLLSSKNFSLKKFHVRKIKTPENLGDWTDWASMLPFAKYKWWLRASPSTQVHRAPSDTTTGDLALGSHRVNHIVHLKGTIPSFPSLPLTGSMKETSPTNASRARHGHKPNKRKHKTKPKPKAAIHLFSFCIPGMLDTPESTLQGNSESKSSANTSGV
jgi:hypothetical protein